MLQRKNPILDTFPSTEFRELSAEEHFGQEWKNSGSLPLQPVGLEVDALDGNPLPFKNLTTGR